MIRIVAIVEGDGEVKAVPVLLRRIGAAVAPLAALDVARPIRVSRGRFLKGSGLEGYVSLAASRAGPGGRPYSPTADQAALTARFDMTAARRRAPSFYKMRRAVSALMLSARSQEDQPGCRPPTVR